MKLLIEVGAFDGFDSLQFYEKGYRVLTFEPNRILFEALRRSTENLENYTVIPKAVCLTNGTMNFNICKYGGASSILPFRSEEELNKTWNQRTDIHYSGETYEVETIRLDTFIESLGLQNEIIDYLHIDAQGVDLECLMSLGKYLSNVKEGVLETVMDQTKSIYTTQEQNVFCNVSAFLEKNQFMVTNVTSNDSTQCEYNVYFKKIVE